MPVPRLAHPGDLAGGDLQRGEQGGGAVPDVVVGAAFGIRLWDATTGPGPGLGTPDRSRSGFGWWDDFTDFRTEATQASRAGPAVVGVSVRVMSFERPGSHNLYRGDEV